LSARATAKAKQVVTFQSLPEVVTSAVASQDQQHDCTQLASMTSNGRAQLGVEVDVPGQLTLPEGHARLFRRSKAGERVDVVSDDVLRASPGIARVMISDPDTITGERKQIGCTNDDIKHRLEEKVELEVTNKGAHAQDVVVHELVWRLPMWRIDPASETTHGTRAGIDAQDYRVRVAATSTTKVAYTVVYTW